MFELIRPDTHYDFIGKWKYCVAGSITIILLGLAAIPVIGIRWGIDFAGGTEVQVHFAEGVKTDEAKIREPCRVWASASRASCATATPTRARSS